MATKPTMIPVWATQNPNNVAAYPQSEVETGFVAGQPIVAEFENGYRKNLGDWVQYLAETQNTATLASTLDPSVRLLGGGIWSWSLTSRTLAWSETAYLAYPGAADAANTIPAGSVTLSAGAIAYVVANEPFTTQATTTTGSSTLTNTLYADVVQVGWTVSGAGIPSNTTVTAINSDGTSINISAAATATANGVTLTFAGSGVLTVQTAAMASFTPAQNSVIVARGTNETCYIGTGTGQMRLHDGEVKGLLEGGYLDIRRLTAGEALAQNQFVYVSQGSADGRTANQAYNADATQLARCGVIGINISQHASGDTAQIVSSGLATGFSNLTPGAIYYLDPANAGGITSSAPSQSGQYAVILGTAMSATTLLLNPCAASSLSQNTPDLTKAGTITGNHIVSAQGFRQQVKMGNITLGATATTGSGANVQNVPWAFSNQIFSDAPYDVDRGQTYRQTRVWSPGYAGSLLNVQITAIASGPGDLVNDNNQKGWTCIVYRNGNAFFTFTNGFFRAGTAWAMFFPADKATYSFAPFDVLTVNLSGPNQNSTRLWLACDLTVEMAA